MGLGLHHEVHHAAGDDDDLDDRLARKLGGDLLVLFGGLWMARRVRREGVRFLLYLAGLSLLAPLDVLTGDALWVADLVPATLVVSLGGLFGAGSAWVWRRRAAPANTGLPGEAGGRPVSSRSSVP